MKRIAALVMAIFVLSVTVPVGAQMTQEQKNQCLLASKGCVDQVDTLQQKIHKLNDEIKKGDRVYNKDEINKLNQKLKEAEKLLNTILYQGGGN